MLDRDKKLHKISIFEVENICPDCGTKLRFQEASFLCPSCGFSIENIYKDDFTISPE